MGRRYEQIEDDENNSYGRQPQPKPRGRGLGGGGGGGRYEVQRPSLKSLQTSMKAKIIKIYTNGDKFYRDRCLNMAFSCKRYRKWDSFLDQVHVDKKPINDTQVRYMFKWPTGEEIATTAEIEDEEDPRFVYIASETRKLYKQGRYGGMEYSGPGGSSFTEKYSRNSHDSRGTNRSQKQSPTAFSSNGSSSNVMRGPVTINVISNTKRQSKQSLFVDPQSRQPFAFEEILRNVTEMLEMDSPPCIALYSVKPPHKKVDSMSSFNRVVPFHGDTFWACGREGEPLEISSKSRDVSPRRNGYSQQKQANGGRQNGYQDDRMRQTNGPKQSNGFEDAHGREFQRHQPSNDDSTDDQSPQHNAYGRGRDTHSPQRQGGDGSPQRKDDRRGREDNSPQRRDDRRDREPPNRQKPKQEAPRKGADPRKRNSRSDMDNDNDDVSPRKGEDNSRRNDKNGTDDDDVSPRKGEDNRRQNGKYDTDNDDDDVSTRKRKDTRRGNDNNDTDDDDDEISRGNTPPEGEIKKRIKEMEDVKSDLDKDIEY